MRQAHFPDAQENIQALHERKSRPSASDFEEFFFMEIGWPCAAAGPRLKKGMPSHLPRYTRKLAIPSPFSLTRRRSSHRRIESDMRSPTL